MATVKRRQLRFAQPLDDRQYGSVHETDVGIGVAVAQLAYPRVVLRSEIDDDVGVRLDVGQQRDKDAGMESLADPVVDFDQHGTWDHQRFVLRFDEGPAGLVMASDRSSDA